MKTRKEWTIADVDLLQKLIDDGKTNEQIAREMKRTKRSIACAVFRYGLTDPQRRRNNWRDDELDLLCDSLSNGASKEEIARLVNRPVASVSQKIKALESKEKVIEEWRHKARLNALEKIEIDPVFDLAAYKPWTNAAA
jgi:predicted transcriptional regulator